MPASAPVSRRTMIWTVIITSVAVFMVSLDNLVVTTALPSIREHLHASLESLEWTVNAYTLTFAVLLLTGATLGERFGRRRIFTAGLAIFTLASAAAALAPNASVLVLARAVQGAGGALVLPLSMTILSSAVPVAKRGAALGFWGAMSGLAVAVGPVVGGAVTEGASWQWIFWLNVPIGVIVIPLAARMLAKGEASRARLDLRGVALVSAGLLGVVFGLVRGNAHGWTSGQVLGSIIGGAILLAGFAAWELRAPSPMLPLRMFASRGFTATNVASFLFSAGMFGAIFLLAQFLQVADHYSPLSAGLRTLPWTGMPMLVAPIAGPLSDRWGGRPLIITGLVLQAAGLGWLALVTAPGVAYSSFILPFVISGIGMALFFVPVANTVLSSVRPEQVGIASGTNNAIRELGGVFGIAVLASVFSSAGSYTSPVSFAHGLDAAVWVGAGVVAIAAVAAVFIPRLRRGAAPALVEADSLATPELVSAR
ncbi:MAG TPA: DHA2 family efflux MFS transporter permease subunit [Streptosporangiaceae bacterium]